MREREETVTRTVVIHGKLAILFFNNVYNKALGAALYTDWRNPEGSCLSCSVSQHLLDPVSFRMLLCH